jgi:hypothetical protein
MEKSIMNEAISEKDAVAQKAKLHPIEVVPVKKWHFANFASTDAAVNFVNATPAQVAGEISANARNDGTVGMFYFL